MSLKTTVEFNKNENMWEVIPYGEIDIYTSTVFKDEVIKSFEENNVDLLINGEKLEYIDSTGLGALISILKRVQESDNKIHLSNIKPNIRKLFDITELDKLFIIRGDKDE